MARKTYLVRVPSGSSGSSLTLTITNDSNGDHVGLVHDTTVCDSEAVSKFTTFVDSSWGLLVSESRLKRAYLGIDVRRESSWHTECMNECLDTFGRHRVFGVESGNTTLHVKGSE